MLLVSSVSIVTLSVAQGPVLVGRTHPTVDLRHLIAAQEFTSWEIIPCNSCLVRSVVTTVRTGVLLCTASIRATRLSTLVTVIARTVDLARRTATRTLAVTRTVTTVSTGNMFGELVTCIGIITLLTVLTVARTLVAIGLTTVAIRCRRFVCSVVVLNATVATGRLRAPRTVLQSLLVAGVDRWRTTTGCTVHIGLPTARTLTISCSATSTRTIVRLG